MKTLYTIFFLLLGTCVFAQSNVVADIDEFNALKALWDNTNGASWTNKTGWPTTGNWPASATAAQMDGWYGVNISNGDISEVNLYNNHLVGTIPSSLGNLTKLTLLRLDHNTLSGTIPSSINNLTSLTQLYLSYNSLSGNIPDLGSLTALKKLSIGSNPAFTAGPFPSWLANLTSLNELFMAASNRNGTIPDFFGDSLTALTAITINGNYLTGPIPVSLTQLSHMQALDVGSNQLSGSIPDEIGNMTALTNLALAVNQFSGTIPSTINNLHNLQLLALYNNSFTGLPEDLGGLTSLKELNLNNNLFAGSLPEFSANPTSLQQINLHFNKFTGTIPASYASLGGLTRISLNDNQLSGSIPSALGSRTTLAYLNVQNNKLTGTIPSELGSLTNLANLFVAGNQLKGLIPSTFSSLTKMVNFSVQNNQLSGEVPSIFSSMTQLFTMNLGGNRFSGTLPQLRGSEIDVSNNAFTGEFPSIGTTATSVIASGNGFSSVNSAISSASLLTKADFTNNELVSLPTSLLSHPAKATLQLLISNNRLDFSTLETFTGFKSSSIYVPQKNIKDETTHTMTVGGSLTLTARNAGAATTIVWEKQSDGGQWSEVGSGVTYTKNPVTKSDEGAYRWRSTSTSFSTTTIQSEPILVKTSQDFIVDNWAFQYKYDGRKRMTHKKVPGADWVYMVYDNRDRLVMTQDGNQRSLFQWTFTRYDALNRPVMTGLYTHGTTVVDQSTMAGLISTSVFAETFNGSGTNFGYSNTVFTAPNFTGTFEPLTVTYYDNYDFTGGDPYFSYKTGELDNQVSTAFPYLKGLVTGVWTKTLGKDKQWIRTVNYYDDKQRLIQSVTDNHRRGKDMITTVYDFVGRPLSTKSSSVAHNVLWGNFHPWAYPTTDRISSANSNNGIYAFSSQQIAASTDGWVEFTCSAYVSATTERNFGLSRAGLTVTNAVEFGVDHKVTSTTNTIQARENGTLRDTPISVQAGDVIRIERKGSSIYYKRNGVTFRTVTAITNALVAHYTPMNSTFAELFNPKISVDGASRSTRRTFHYDHAGRLIDTYHSVDGDTAVLLSHNDYNELGQLIDKKLHTNRQSLDYRYNIRGWLTSINGADLASAGKNSDLSTERKDLFGMDLLYNEVNTGIDNDALYNGNISSMRWSNNLGLGAMKERAYKFSYDPMNRLNSAVQKTFNSNDPNPWASSSAFHESGVTYDLNGNIQTLNRTTGDGTSMDQLTYDYGDGNGAGNQLLTVSDEAYDKSGFADGTNATEDYVYDNNGNLVVDRNKDIASIAYNHLNLPEKVTKSNGDYIYYTYDATGRKLMQDVYSAGVLKKRSDYQGEWFYENDTLRFVNHEEGRVVTEGAWTAAPQLLPDPQATSVSNFAVVGTTLAIQTINSESYLVVTSAQATTKGGFLSTDLMVNAGKMYTLKMKGYNGSQASKVYMYVEGVGQVTATVLVAKGPELLYGDATGEQWIEVTFSVPATMNRLRLGAKWNSAVAIGEKFYINDMELYEYNGVNGNQVLTQNGYTYQYHLKDHLGNVRMTFTTKDEREESIANLETATSDFLYYDEAVKINSEIFDHTDTLSTHYSARLNGTPKERYGLAKSLSVMPGDTINMEVFVKYLNPDPGTLTPALQDFMSSLLPGGSAPAGTFIDGGLAGSTGGLLFPFWSLFSPAPENDNEDAPKAYMNWLVFDRDYNLKDGGAIQISTAAEEHGQDGDHEELSRQLAITEPGYVYVYLSNDNYALAGGQAEDIVEVYFDDFKVEHVKSPVIQSEDFYAFGLSFNSYSRENSLSNQYQYNGKELQDELSLGWLDYGARMYMSDIGRWGVIDPMSELSRRWSPYTYGKNNPIRFIDPDGMFDVGIHGDQKDKAFAQLQSSVKSELNLSMDSKGNVTYTKAGDGALSKDAQKLTNAIDDHSSQVNVNATSSKTTPDGDPIVGGAWLGTKNTGETTSDGTSVVQGNQQVNPDVLGKIDNYYGTPGKSMLHEVTESYEGTKITQVTGQEYQSSLKNPGVFQTIHEDNSTPSPVGRNDISIKLFTNSGAVSKIGWDATSGAAILKAGSKAAVELTRFPVKFK